MHHYCAKVRQCVRRRLNQRSCRPAGPPGVCTLCLVQNQLNWKAYCKRTARWSLSSPCTAGVTAWCPARCPASWSPRRSACSTTGWKMCSEVNWLVSFKLESIKMDSVLSFNRLQWATIVITVFEQQMMMVSVAPVFNMNGKSMAGPGC